jgi:acetyl esterase/lipase
MDAGSNDVEFSDKRTPATRSRQLTRGLVAKNGYDLSGSIGYGTGPRQVLDLYSPSDAKRAPVVVFFYGGSWQSGSRETYRFLGSALARRGLVTVVPDYRVYPEVTFPGFLEDGAAAVDWVRGNVARYGGDRERIVLMGHSAGAHIAAMLAIDARWLAKVGIDSRKDVAALVGLAGPYDFLPIRDQTLKLLFKGANRRETQPITFVEGGEAPALLITGGRDTTVDPGNSKRLAARLKAKGSDARAVVRPLLGHLSILGLFVPPINVISSTFNTIEHFVEQATSNAAPSRTSESPL